MVLFTTADMAQQLEEADMIHLTRQIEACRQIFPQHKFVAEPIGHGIAAVGLPIFGRKLNRVIGLGVAGSVSPKDVETIEKLFLENSATAVIDLCPLAHPTVLKALAAGGYTIDGWISSYVRSLTDEDLQEVDISGVEVSYVTPDQYEEFQRSSLEGFRDNGRPALLLETLARIAVLRADTSLYFAMVDGKIAASGALAQIETSRGKIAHLYIDSTLPEYRGRGIQAALLRSRLSDARRAGFDLAYVRVQPASVSARNIERAGFSLAYMNARFLKMAEL